jgi:hypothetical protein
MEPDPKGSRQSKQQLGCVLGAVGPACCILTFGFFFGLSPRSANWEWTLFYGLLAFGAALTLVGIAIFEISRRK